MIELKDKFGHVLCKVSEQMFPLQVTKENSENTHKIFAKFVTAKNGEREIKSMNMGK